MSRYQERIVQLGGMFVLWYESKLNVYDHIVCIFGRQISDWFQIVGTSNKMTASVIEDNSWHGIGYDRSIEWLVDTNGNMFNQLIDDHDLI